MEMPAVVDEELVYLQECAQPIQMSCVNFLAIPLELPSHKHTFNIHFFQNLLNLMKLKIAYQIVTISLFFLLFFFSCLVHSWYCSLCSVDLSGQNTSSLFPVFLTE